MEKTRVRAHALWERAVAAAPPWQAAGPPESGDVLERVMLSLRRPFLAVFMLSLAMNLLALTMPIYMLQVYDRVLTSYSAETLVMLTVMALGLLLLFVALDNVRSLILTRAALASEQILGPTLLTAAVKDQLAGRTDAGQPLRDLVALRAFAGTPVVPALFDAPLVPIYVLVTFFIHWSIGLIALAGTVGMVALTVLNQRSTGKRAERAGKGTNILIGAAETQIRNADAIEAMGLMPNLAGHWRDNQDRVLRVQMSANERGGRFQVATRYARLALQVLVLALGASLVLASHITAGMMFAASLILSRGLQPVELAVSSWRTLIAAKQNFERVGGALKRLGPPREAMALPEPEGCLEAEHVTYVVGPERRQILRNISFALAPGEMLGVTGPAASGKSTLARVLLGVLAPSAGKVRLDGADISQWERSLLGRHVGYLPQEVELFPATVAQNIARMGAVDPEAVVAAARWAGVHDLILRLPHGYDTRIMAGGLMLSPGQRQRVALARALYGDPKILVLDEPNANLDGDGEVALAEALKGAKARGITVIVIAHRLGILQQADKMLLLRDGGVQAFGPRSEVLPRLAQRPAPQTGTVVPMPANKPGSAS